MTVIVTVIGQSKVVDEAGEWLIFLPALLVAQARMRLPHSCGKRRKQGAA